MDNTPNLLLPYILPAQAQKFLSHNEALQTLDALVMLAVLSRAESAPPADPGEGDRYIVGASPTGEWAGGADKLACWQDGGWTLLPPREGWLAWCAAEAGLLCFTGGAWMATGLGAGVLQNLSLLGVNATADSTNRLSIAADATLLSHGGGSHRLTVNKNTPGDTASLVLQQGFSARAELGLAGDEDFHLKVSPDGSSFIEALKIDRTTGKPSFPQVNFLDGHAINLYQDSGRMAGSGTVSIIAATFAFPAYLTLYNGSTVASQGKFISDNTDYGGAGGSMDGEVKSLVDQIRDSSHRRYGIEYFVASVTAGSGTADGVSFAGDTYYRSVFTAQQLRPPAATFHVYLKVLDDSILVPLAGGQTALKNGVTQATSFLVTPANGWVSLTITDAQDPRTTYGYAPEILVLRAKAAGDRLLLACPALIGGATSIDDDIGVIAGYNSWAA